MQLSVDYVDVRCSAHATEDPERVRKAMYNLLPTGFLKEIIFQETTVKGHHGNPIILFQKRIENRDVARDFARKIVSRLSKSDKERILQESEVFIEKGNLYLRLDKQAAFLNQLKLKKADPIYVRIRFRSNDEDIPRILNETS